MFAKVDKLLYLRSEIMLKKGYQTIPQRFIIYLVSYVALNLHTNPLNPFDEKKKRFRISYQVNYVIKKTKFVEFPFRFPQIIIHLLKNLSN